ncbi:M23 family metallopeptidase [Leptolyngbya sp. AN10]
MIAAIFANWLQFSQKYSVSEHCQTGYPVAHPRINLGFGPGPDPFNPGKTRFHSGLDFDGKIGDPIISPICGTVTYVGREQNMDSYEWGYGWHVKIRDDQNRIHIFGHVSKIHVHSQDRITSRQLIAEIGNNGNSTGPHLHYEIRQGGDKSTDAVDPTLFLRNAS